MLVSWLALPTQEMDLIPVLDQESPRLVVQVEQEVQSQVLEEEEQVRQQGQVQEQERVREEGEQDEERLTRLRTKEVAGRPALKFNFN